jgi:excisionase family DNA binding protein
MILGEVLRTELKQLVKEALREEFSAQKSTIETIERNSEDPQSYISVKEAAKISRLGVSTLRLAIRKKRLKAHHVGTRVLIKKEDFAFYLESNPTS